MVDCTPPFISLCVLFGLPGKMHQTNRRSGEEIFHKRFSKWLNYFRAVILNHAEGSVGITHLESIIWQKYI